MNRDAIGVFDSGLGGLTAVKALNEILPNENIIFFGDTARVPYGTRSRQTILRYTKEDVAFLRRYPVKMIIAACGTVSSMLGIVLGEVVGHHVVDGEQDLAALGLGLLEHLARGLDPIGLLQAGAHGVAQQDPPEFPVLLGCFGHAEVEVQQVGGRFSGAVYDRYLQYSAQCLRVRV